MDLLPIKPASTNKVDTSINLANDGCSKSNTGYFINRGQEEKPQENFDEVKFSNLHSKTDEPSVESDLIPRITKLLNKIKDTLFKFLRFKKKELYNIFEKPSN